MSEFKEKIVLITGAAGTIGRETSRRFKNERAILVLIDKDKEKLAELKSYIGENQDILYIEADCTDEEQVKQYVQKTVELFGGIDVFVHFVGITGTVGPITSLEVEDFDKSFKTDIISAFFNHKYIYPVMEKQKSGSILYISASAGVRGIPNFACFTAANHGLLGLMKSTALEAALSGVRVNAIVPAPVDSPVMREVEKQIFPENPEIAQQQIINKLPLGRYLTSEEIAESVLFFSSARASYINGNAHSMDGGYMVK